MSLMYINENGANVTINSNRIKVSYRDGTNRDFPIESIDGLVFLGKAQISTQCMEHCLRKGILF